MWRKRMALAVAMLTAPALAACPSNGETAATTTTAKDVCTVVDVADVETAIGTDFGPGAPLVSGASKGCQFDAADGTGSVQVFISTGTDRQGWEQLKESYPDPEPVAGVGDDAAWSDRLHTFLAFKKSAVVIVSLNLKTEVDQRLWAIDIGGAALGRVKV